MTAVGPEYVELHCHSYYSLLDGASSPEELVAQAVARRHGPRKALSAEQYKAVYNERLLRHIACLHRRRVQGDPLKQQLGLTPSTYLFDSHTDMKVMLHSIP